MNFADTDNLLNYTELRLLQPLQDFLTIFRFLYWFFVVPNNFIVSGVCNSNLYRTLILNTNLLLIILIYT